MLQKFSVSIFSKKSAYNEIMVASADDDYQKIINCRQLRNKKRESCPDHTANSPFKYSLLQPLEDHAEAFKGTTFRN